MSLTRGGTHANWVISEISKDGEITVTVIECPVHDSAEEVLAQARTLLGKDYQNRRLVARPQPGGPNL